MPLGRAWPLPSCVDVPLLAIHRVVPAAARHRGVARRRHVELAKDAEGVLAAKNVEVGHCWGVQTERVMSGKQTGCLGKMAIFRVDLPIQNGEFSLLC